MRFIFNLHIFTLTLALFFYGCKPSLEEKEQTIDVFYVAWGCDCANWMTSESYAQYKKDLEQGNDKCEKQGTCFDIEPADPNVQIPGDTWNEDGTMRIYRLTGSFYKGQISRTSEEGTRYAKTFRYTHCEIVKK